MTDAELVEIEARAAAASDGPWRIHLGGLPIDDGDALAGDGEAPDGAAHESRFVADFGRWWVLSEDPDEDWVVHGNVGRWHGRDAIFVAHAREDIPRLLTEVRRLRAELDRADHQATVLT
jgi:hypothetical protein